jgi:ribosomal protein L37E
MSNRYTITHGAEGTSITCHRCTLTSYSAGDVKHRYCAYCHVFHDQLDEFERAVKASDAKEEGVTHLAPGIFIVHGKKQ